MFAVIVAKSDMKYLRRMNKLMPSNKTIKCPKYPYKILMLPDVKAMAEAIKNHAESHKRLSRVAKANIVNNLTQQSLLHAVNAKPIKVYLLIESYNGFKKVHGVALSVEQAEAWMDAKNAEDPQGSFFFDSSEVLQGDSFS